MSSILEFFDGIDKNEYIIIAISSMLAIITGLVIGFSRSLSWVWILSLVLLVLFIVFSLLTYYANYKWKKREVEILTSAPSFPEQVYCEVCGNDLSEGERRIQNDLLIIICPKCNAENIVKGENL